MPRQMLKIHHVKAETPLFSPCLFLLLSMTGHGIKHSLGSSGQLSQLCLLPFSYKGPPQLPVGKALKLCKHHPETGKTLVCYQHPHSHKSKTAPNQLLWRWPTPCLQGPVLGAAIPKCDFSYVLCSGPGSWAQHAAVTMHSIRPAPLQPQAQAQSATHCTENPPSRAFYFAVLWMKSSRNIIIIIKKHSVSHNDRNWWHRPEEDEDGFSVGHPINLLIIV